MTPSPRSRPATSPPRQNTSTIGEAMEAHAVTLLNSILSSHARDVAPLGPAVRKILQFMDDRTWLKLGTLCLTERERDCPMEYLISLFDEVLFDGHVGTITFLWDPSLVTEMGAKGLCWRNSYGETEIVVDPAPPAEDIVARATSIIGTLLHECVHAVFSKACHHSTPHEHPDCKIHTGLTRHGPVWLSLAEAVEGRVRRLIWRRLDIQLGIADAEWEESVSYSLACTLIFIALEPSVTTGAQPRQCYQEYMDRKLVRDICTTPAAISSLWQSLRSSWYNRVGKACCPYTKWSSCDQDLIATTYSTVSLRGLGLHHAPVVATIAGLPRSLPPTSSEALPRAFCQSRMTRRAHRAFMGASARPGQIARVCKASV